MRRNIRVRHSGLCLKLLINLQNNSSTQAGWTEWFPLLINYTWSCSEYKIQSHCSQLPSWGNISFQVECCYCSLMRQNLSETALFTSWISLWTTAVTSVTEAQDASFTNLPLFVQSTRKWYKSLHLSPRIAIAWRGHALVRPSARTHSTKKKPRFFTEVM